MKRLDLVKRSTNESLFKQRSKFIAQIKSIDEQLDSDTISCADMEKLMKKQLHIKWKKREIERELMSRNVEWSVW